MTSQENPAEPDPGGAQATCSGLGRKAGVHAPERRKTLLGPPTPASLCATTLDKTPDLAVPPGPHLRHRDAKCSFPWASCDDSRGRAQDGTPPLLSARGGWCRQTTFGGKACMSKGQSGKEVTLGDIITVPLRM